MHSNTPSLPSLHACDPTRTSIYLQALAFDVMCKDHDFHDLEDHGQLSPLASFCEKTPFMHGFWLILLQFFSCFGPHKSALFLP